MIKKKYLTDFCPAVNKNLQKCELESSYCRIEFNNHCIMFPWICCIEIFGSFLRTGKRTDLPGRSRSVTIRHSAFIIRVWQWQLCWEKLALFLGQCYWNKRSVLQECRGISFCLLSLRLVRRRFFCINQLIRRFRFSLIF